MRKKCHNKKLKVPIRYNISVENTISHLYFFILKPVNRRVFLVTNEHLLMITSAERGGHLFSYSEGA